MDKNNLPNSDQSVFFADVLEEKMTTTFAHAASHSLMFEEYRELLIFLQKKKLLLRPQTSMVGFMRK